MNGRPKSLSEEDRILWHQVTKSVRPLHPVTAPAEDIQPAPPPPRPAAARPSPKDRPAQAPPLQKPLPPPRPTGLDERTHGKIARKRLSIDARIDLHGMTQAEAHRRLLGFLTQAHASGMRHVLVITGKGSAGGGVLRGAVPDWLSTVPFSGMVGAYASAARHHGGDGALYVRLRRQDRQR